MTVKNVQDYNKEMKVLCFDILGNIFRRNMTQMHNKGNIKNMAEAARFQHLLLVFTVINYCSGCDIREIFLCDRHLKYFLSMNSFSAHSVWSAVGAGAVTRFIQISAMVSSPQVFSQVFIQIY